jgi:uncharacterized protein YkwD
VHTGTPRENCLYKDFNLSFLDKTQSFETQLINVWVRSKLHCQNLCSYVKKAGIGVSYVQLDACTIRVYAVYVATEPIYK